MITSITLIAYPVSHMEQVPAFPVDCFDHPSSFQ